MCFKESIPALCKADRLPIFAGTDLIAMLPETEQLIYPIGRHQAPAHYTPELVADWVADIRILPRLLDYCLENLDAAQLEEPYREGGWNTNQIVHHLADSHMNAFIRFKLALTENNPVIKPYDQVAWAELPDVRKVPANYSVTLVHALHHRWVTLMESLSETDWTRSYIHPEYQKQYALWEVAHLYAWHGRHHAEQMRQLRLRKDW